MMAKTRTLRIGGIDTELYQWLVVRAALRDRSVEAEVTAMLAAAKSADESARAAGPTGLPLSP